MLFFRESSIISFNTLSYTGIKIFPCDLDMISIYYLWNTLPRLYIDFFMKNKEAYSNVIQLDFSSLPWHGYKIYISMLFFLIFGLFAFHLLSAVTDTNLIKTQMEKEVIDENEYKLKAEMVILHYLFCLIFL